MTLIFFWWTPSQQDGRTCLKEKNFSNSCQQWVGSRTPGAPALWVMRSWERGWGPASLPMTCWCHSASFPLPSALPGCPMRDSLASVFAYLVHGPPLTGCREMLNGSSLPLLPLGSSGARGLPHILSWQVQGVTTQLCFLIRCLALSELFSQGASIFEFHGCNHCPQWFWSPKKIKSATLSIVSPSTCNEVTRPGAMIFIFWMLSFKPALRFSSFTFIKRLFSSSLLSAFRVVSSAYLRWLIFLPAIR